MKNSAVKYGLLIIGLIVVINSSASSQNNKSQEVSHPSGPLVYRSDTLPVMMIPEVNIYDVNKYNYLKSFRYRRTIYNVKKAYPYAVVANLKLKRLDEQLSQIELQKERREYLKESEKELMDEFEGELRHLTITQGIILVKLIDREIGLTSYEVIKDMRGGFSAFFWQGIARLFGNDLKLQYDPDGEDKVMEDIIMAIDRGFI